MKASFPDPALGNGFWGWGRSPLTQFLGGGILERINGIFLI